MKKGIIICITTGLAAFALTFLGLTMVNRMAVRELENKSVEEVKEESAPVKQVVSAKPSNWLQETTEILVADPPLLSLELEQEEEVSQEKLPEVEVGPDSTEINAGGSVCEFVKMIKVKDQVYISTDAVVEVLRCGVMDGEIDSTVEAGVVPEENNQSNFGTGYGYQIISTDVVDVFIDGEWIMFTPADREIYIDRNWKPEEDEANLMTVTSDKQTTDAYEMFASSYTWGEHGWLCACGMEPTSSLQQIAEELPELTYADDFSFKLRGNAELCELMIYDRNFKRMEGVAELADLHPGKYYVCYRVEEKGRFIEKEEQYEVTTYYCVFEMLFSGVNTRVG